jgi:hypothetical protein
MKTLAEIQKEVHEVSKSKGWWDMPVSVSDTIANLHGEISEAFEEYRSGRDISEIYMSEGGKPEGFKIELTDEVIRIMDFFEQQGWDLAAMIELKTAYNKTRPYRHGNKIA